MSLPLIDISRQKALIFAGFLVLYQFLTYIANDMIMPGMIKVTESFNGPESAIATSLTAYILGGATLQLLLGPISDRFGRRPVMLFGALLFLLCTLFIACSQSMEQFLWARFFQGMGLCFTGVVGYATLQEIFAEMDAVRLIAVLSNIASFAPLLGPLAGALFILHFNWRVIFAIIALFALVAFLGLLRYMPESVGARQKDGSVIMPIPLTLFSTLNNYRRLLVNRPFITGSLTFGLISVPCVAWIALSPIIIVTEAKLSVISYALWQFPIFSAGILGNWYLHRLTHHYTLKQIITKGSIYICSGLMLVFALTYSVSHSFYALMPGLIIYGFGIGIATGPLTRYVLFSTRISKGTAYAMMSMISMAIQGIGVEVSNHVYRHHSNLLFSVYCVIIGIVYILSVFYTFSHSQSQQLQSTDLSLDKSVL